MKFPTTQKLIDIANLINAKYIGPNDFPVEGINEIHVVEEGDIVFVDHPKCENWSTFQTFPTIDSTHCF